MKIKLGLLLVAFFQFSTGFAQTQELAITWGGKGILLNLNFNASKPSIPIEAGSGVMFDCAHGSLDNVASDGNGGFIAFGKYFSEQGAVVFPGNGTSEKNALYVGQLNSKKQLKLSTYIINAGKPEILRVDLVSTKTDPIIHKCLGSATGNN